MYIKKYLIRSCPILLSYITACQGLHNSVKMDENSYKGVNPGLHYKIEGVNDDRFELISNQFQFVDHENKILRRLNLGEKIKTGIYIINGKIQEFENGLVCPGSEQDEKANGEYTIDGENKIIFYFLDDELVNQNSFKFVNYKNKILRRVNPGEKIETGMYIINGKIERFENGSQYFREEKE